MPIQDSLEKNPQSESHDFKYFSNGQANRNDFQEDHDGEENHSKSKIPCRYFASGFCSRGDKCFYSHDIDQVKITFFFFEQLINCSFLKKEIKW